MYDSMTAALHLNNLHRLRQQSALKSSQKFGYNAFSGVTCTLYRVGLTNPSRKKEIGEI